MAISEKNKEIITNRIAGRIDSAIDSWNKAGQMVAEMAEKSNLVEMYKLAVKHKVGLCFTNIVYNKNTSNEFVVGGLVYDDGIRLNVQYRRLHGKYNIGTKDHGSYHIFPRDLIYLYNNLSPHYTSDYIAKSFVDNHIDTNSDYVIFMYENLNEDFAKIVFDCVCDAMNKYIAVITDAYNIARQKERENDAKVLSAFGLDDGSVVNVEPKQFKITIEEVKGE